MSLVLLFAAATLPLMDRPDWIRTPTPQDIAAFYPKAAMDERIVGQASVDCVVEVDGGLRDCHVSQEAPQAYGFGIAAAGLAEQLRVRPMQHDGRNVEARIQTTIKFELPAEDPLPSFAEALDCVARARVTLERTPNRYDSWNDLTFWTFVMDENAGRQRLKPSDVHARVDAVLAQTGSSAEASPPPNDCHADFLRIKASQDMPHGSGAAHKPSPAAIPASGATPAQAPAGAKPAPSNPEPPKH